LIIKKKFRADFKEFILDENLSNEEKVNLMDDSYKNIFEQINDLVEKIELDIDKEQNLKNLEKIILQNKNRTDLFFDALKSLDSVENKNILDFLKAVKILLKSLLASLFKEGNDIDKLEQELSNSLKTYFDYHKQKLKDL
jgi:hypothetical protein